MHHNSWACICWAWAPQEKPPQWEAQGPQPEKAHVQQQGPSIAKTNKVKQKFKNQLKGISDPMSTTLWAMSIISKAVWSLHMTVLRKLSGLGHSLWTNQNEKVECYIDLFWQLGIPF